jgi:tetratricopeptide (TPR) repeat protein
MRPHLRLALPLGLVLAACSGPRTSVLVEGPAIDSGDRSARVLHGDLLLREGGRTAIVVDAIAADAPLEFTTTRRAWTFDLPDGELVWNADGVRVGDRVHALEAPGALVLDARGQRLESEPLEPHYLIGAIHRDVTTDSAAAQVWFDRGLALCFGFNHAEAVDCFQRAIELDPGCAMAHWGVAYALGPNYNSPVIDDASSLAAFAAITRARAELDDESDVERALVEALSTRFSAEPPADRIGLDADYAVAMRRVAARFPDDRDVGALMGESVMQLRPWNLWSHDGVAAPELAEVRAVLEAGLERWPDHPALCHLYIHAMEAGPEVELALPAARRLEGLAPGLGHLVHMPSHTYVWTGHYDDVVRTNLAAVKTDDAYAAATQRQGMYTAYRIHNYHFVAYGAMWEGRRELALEHARAIPAQISPEELAAIPDLFDVFHATPYHVMVRFGMWDELVAEPDPGAELPATRTIWHYARGVAFAALGRVDEAEAAQAAFRASREDVPSTRVLFQNPVELVYDVAEAFLEGEIEYRKGNYDAAFASLHEAVLLDEKLNYDEPWGWMEPTRHALGALLAEQGWHEEAVDVYRANLARYPENGWALYGLSKSLAALGHTEEAAAARARYDVAWARADTPLFAACMCANGK